MTIGTQFLARLNEAKKPEAKKPAYEFDRGTEAMKRAMRTVGGETDLGDKIAEVLNLAGVPGMYLNKPAVRESVIDAAQSLRSKPARVTAFLALHSALLTRASSLKEAKEEDLEGQGFQQLVEEVMISLGLPEEMAGSGAPAGVKTGIKRTVAALKSDATVRMAFIVYAQRASIKLHDSLVGAKKDAMASMKAKKVTEAEEPARADEHGAAAFLTAAKSIAMALGIPQKALDLPMTAMAMKKTAIRNGANTRAVAMMDKAKGLLKSAM